MWIHDQKVNDNQDDHREGDIKKIKIIIISNNNNNNKPSDGLPTSIS